MSKATNPDLRCGSGSSEWCAVSHAINDVCESILAVHFELFYFFCFDSREEKSRYQMNQNWLGRF